jgi:hypothetical protein
MARGLQFKLVAVPSAFKDAVDRKRQQLAAATTGAMREVELVAKQYARESVRKGGAGFRTRWPNAVRSRTFPERGKEAIGPAALIWVRSTYAGIFEKGANVRGKPYLWLPLRGVPASFQRKKIRPGLLRGLVTIRRPGKNPLLGIRVKATEARAKGPISGGLLTRGTSEKSKAKRGARSRIRVIPLFVGIRTATITKKWDIKGAVQRAGLQLGNKIRTKLRG